MKEEIQNLIALQNIDLEVRKIDDQMNQGYGELDRKQALISERRDKIAELRQTLAESERRRRELEALIEDESARLKDRQSKLMNVQTGREYGSLVKEIEDTKLANKSRDEELVLLLEQSEAITKHIEELETLCQTEQDQIETERVAVEKQSVKLQSQKEKIQKKREDQANRVNGKYLKRYEVLREKRSGLAVTGVTRGVCRGCNMNIPPQMFNQLLKEMEILSCPTCNRMMYHVAEEEA